MIMVCVFLFFVLFLLFSNHFQIGQNYFIIYYVYKYMYLCMYVYMY